jgi:cephalosporin hydroxylase
MSYLIVDGIIAAQTPEIEGPFKKMLGDVQQVIEIGYLHGGFSLWLHRNKSPGCALVCYDITGENLLVFPEQYIDFRIGDCFAPDIANEIIDLLRQPRRTLLLCDGGNKEEEFNFYCPYLKPGDIIMMHDYADNNEDFENIKARLDWPSGPESFYDNIQEKASIYNLEKHQYGEMKSVLWGSFIKSGFEALP